MDPLPRPATARKLRVTVLAGGPSAEREVSLQSGRAIADALRRRGHDVFVADVGPDNLAALDHLADVVFPALHGTFGEDGTLQCIMEQRGIRFVGSGSRASAASMDKALAKKAAIVVGAATPESEVVTGRPETSMSVPVVVKPVDQGSSVATSIVRRAADLPPAIEKVLRSFGRALVERFIAGDELTVGVVGEETLPPICVRPKREFYDYEAKYLVEDTEYAFETGLPLPVLDEARELSRRIFLELGCRHLGRVDWIVDADHQLWFLELNTLPGFTNHSLVPKAAEYVGIPFDELVERLVFMAATDTR
ncbi:MAG: D-alanine--D-alanine ligase [Planctomycetes bacterium]|nr:D-alanine--D-alanine ligase [Planctomycetota bacterium]